MTNRDAQAAFVKARAAQEAAALANGDVSSIINSINGIAQQLSDLINTVSQLQNTYNGHKHGYSDIDNLGATQNKTTSTPQ